jgi:putative flippase GtrA
MGLWRRILDIGFRIAKTHQVKIRYLLAGGLNTVVGLSVYPMLYYLASSLELHYLIILVISQLVCIAFSFLTSKFLVFRTSGNYRQEFWRFLTFHAFYFLLNLVVLPILVDFVGLNPVWAQTIFALLIIVSSYFWHSRYTFTSIKVLP